MFAALHLAINSLQSGPLYLMDQPNLNNGVAAKVKYGIISEAKFVGTISVD
jgi:hypothetical protein